MCQICSSIYQLDIISMLMLISYCCMLMLIAYCSIPMVFTDIQRMAFAVNAFNATNRDGLSVHLHDEIIYLIVLLELTKTIIGQG